MKTETATRRLWVRWVAGMAVVVSLLVLASWPVTTRFGVNFQWYSRQLTLFEKAAHFLSRDLQARRLAADVVGGEADSQEALRKILAWSVAHVQPTPPGLPVVDDHVMHIIIRGYGAPDQRTEAFALLASYAGFPATAAVLKAPGTDQGLVIALVRDGTRTVVFDVNHHLSFRNEEGDLADLNDLARNPQLVDQAGDLIVGGLPYGRYFLGIRDLQGSFARMEAQRPLPRLRQEVARLLGVHASRSAVE